MLLLLNLTKIVLYIIVLKGVADAAKFGTVVVWSMILNNAKIIMFFIFPVKGCEK